MARSLAVAAENSRKHAALSSRVLDLSDLPSAAWQRIERRAVAPRLAYEDAVLEVEMGQQKRPDIAGAQRGAHDPHPGKRVLPLLRQFADRAGDLGCALGAVKLAGDDVAMHLCVFPDWCLNLAPDAATRGEPGYNVKEMHGRPPFYSAPFKLGISRMILYPAIDLKDGQCVRLQQGHMDKATVFNLSPAEQARQFAAQGFSSIHVVDLNGAFEGRSVNAEAVSAILDAVQIPVQLGGGIRTLDSISFWIGRGVARVILGTAAVRDPELVRQACARFPGKIAVGIDAREGRVAVEGWAETSELTAASLARRFQDIGVAAIVYTDIDRDGMLTGLNLDATAEIARAVRIPVIASGGLAGIEDIKRLISPQYAMIAGAIAGRALYDGRLDAKAALELTGEAS